MVLPVVIRRMIDPSATPSQAIGIQNTYVLPGLLGWGSTREQTLTY